VAGNTETVTPKANGTDWDVTDTSIGLQVIAPQDGTLLDKIDTDASLVRLSPQGRQVFLMGWKNGTPWTEIYDISSKSIIRHLDGIYLIPTRRLDGKEILVSSRTTNGAVSYITLLDPDTLAATSEWKGTGDVGWLIDP
jgi:hypothetical protein